MWTSDNSFEQVLPCPSVVLCSITVEECGHLLVLQMAEQGVWFRPFFKKVNKNDN